MLYLVPFFIWNEKGDKKTRQIGPAEPFNGEPAEPPNHQPYFF